MVERKMKNKVIIFLLFIITFDVSAKKSFKVGVLADNPRYKHFIELVKNEVKVIDSNQHSIYFTDPIYNNDDAELASISYSKASSNNDIVLALGMHNTIMMTRQRDVYTPTIVTGNINIDFVDNIDLFRKSMISNVNYLLSSFSYSKDLKKFHHLAKFNKVAIIVDKDNEGELPLERVFDPIADSLSIDYVLHRISVDSIDVRLLKDCDAVYFATRSLFRQSGFKVFIEFLNLNNIPSFSASNNDNFSQGVLGTLQKEKNDVLFARQVALNILSLKDGAKAESLPRIFLQEEKLHVNIPTAKIVGIPLSFEMLGSVVFTNHAVSSENETKLSLKKALEIMLSDNVSLLAKKKNLDIAKMDEKDAKGKYLPEISVDMNGGYLDPKVAKSAMGQNPEITADLSIQLKQLVYSYDASKSIQIRKYLTQAEESDFITEQVEALYGLSDLYYQALVIQSNLEILYHNLQLTESNLEVASQKYLLGQSSKSDVYRLESQRSQQIQDIITTNTKLQTILKSLNVGLNRDTNSSIVLDDTILDQAYFNLRFGRLNEKLVNYESYIKLEESLVRYAHDHASCLQSLEHQRNALIEESKIYTRGRWFPTISGYGTLGRTILREGQGTDFPQGFPSVPMQKYQIGIQLSYPVFNQKHRNIMKKKTRLQLNQTKEFEEYQEDIIKQQVESSLIGLKGEFRNIKLANENVDLSFKSLKLVQESYAQGQSTIIDVIDAQNSYIKAKQQIVLSKLSFYTTLMEIERATGYFFALHSDNENEIFISKK